MAVWQLDDGEAHSHNEIPVFQIPMQWLEHRNLVVGMSFSIVRSEEHTSELQSRLHLVCRLLLGKKKRLKSSHGYMSYAVICVYTTNCSPLIQVPLHEHLPSLVHLTLLISIQRAPSVDTIAHRRP